MSAPFGSSRSCVRRNYALITPDTHVATAIPGWENASAAVHISAELGARFVLYTAWLEAGATSAMPAPGVERFVYVLEGAIALQAEGKTFGLSAGGYAFVPPGCEHSITTSRSARLAVFEKPFQPHTTGERPWLCVGDASDAPGDHFQGDTSLWLQTFLPVDPPFDMAVNLFTFQPGGTLPQVEIHVMEHGLLLVDGAGVYRLGDNYHPVQAGDVIWMASYCPQWFVAMGKQPARYLYYKDVHRSPVGRVVGDV